MSDEPKLVDGVWMVPKHPSGYSVDQVQAAARERIAELEAELAAIASRNIPHPNGDWAEVEYAAAACARLGIPYQTKWDQDQQGGQT